MTDHPRSDIIRPPISFEEMQEALRLAHVERSRYLGALILAYPVVTHSH